jgi:phage terminase large subunit-like protein
MPVEKRPRYAGPRRNFSWPNGKVISQVTRKNLYKKLRMIYNDQMIQTEKSQHITFE